MERMSKRQYYHDEIVAGEYVTDKEKATTAFIRYMLSRTQSMFQYKGLPDSIPQRMLEMYLQKNGNCFIAKVDGTLYAFTGGLGGEPDAYYRPTIYTVANPFLNLSKNYKIDVDGVLMLNDSLLMGLMPMLNKYASLMTENVLTIRTATILLRLIGMLSASDDKTKKSADKFIEDLEKGKISAIAESAFFDGIKLQSVTNSNSSYLQQFIELQQYLKASLFNELGLNANYNMKREAIGGNEAALNEDFLLPYCDDMLKCRREALEQINAMFDTEITVDFSSSWKINEKEIASQLAEKNGENAETISISGETETETGEQEQETETEEQETDTETGEQEQEKPDEKQGGEQDERNKDKERNNNE